MSKKVKILVTIVAVTLSRLAYSNVYVVRSSRNRGNLYWNSNEALILIESSTAGSRMK
jgi:hypothetical protein